MARSKGLGFLFAPKDARDYHYLMRSAAPQVKAVAKPKPRVTAYREQPVRDQGQTPMCVGFSSRGFLDAAPLMSKLTDEPTPQAIYRSAQLNDEWPGTNYDGTSVRGAMIALKAAGLIGGYAWGQTVDDAIAWMNGGFGTVVIGVNWYAEMDNVDAKGFVVPPSAVATPIGGHAFRLNWWDKKRNGFLMINSWGHEWGQKRGQTLSGTAYFSRELVERLLAEDGEIAGPTQIKLAGVMP